MALSPQEIYDLDKEIFNFLYNKHLEAKAKGEEFYFNVERNYSIKLQNYYWFPCYNNELISISFYSYKEIGFFISKVEANKYSFIPYIFTSVNSTINEKLISFLQTQNGNWNIKNIEIEKGMFTKAYTNKELFFPSIEQTINYYLVEYKPQIDKFISEYESKNQKSLSEATVFSLIITKEEFEISIKRGEFMLSLPPISNNIMNLPLSLSRFFIKKHLGIEEIEIQHISPNTRWVFLTGENAAGKTSILKSLYHCLINYSNFIDYSGFMYGVEILKREYIYNYGYSYFDKIDNQIVNFEENYISEGERIIYLGANNKGFSINAYLKDFVKFLYDRFKSKNRKYHFTSLVEIIKEFLPNLARVEVDENIEAEEYEKAVLFYEKDEDGNELAAVSFDDLAMGYKNIINLVANIIVGLSNEKEKITEFIMPKDLYGIVIIDEFEQHLHPKMQRFLVEKLTTLFPKVQFIVSTHSPIPLLGAPKETAIFHVERTKEKGITIERVDEYVDWENLTPNLMFSSPIFGFSDLIPFAHKKGEKIRTIYSYGNEELMEKLDQNAAKREKDLQSIFEEE